MIDDILKLYLVTDNGMLKGRDFFDVLEEALKLGVTIVQLREKNISSKDYYYKALKTKEITDKYNVPLIINDRVDIALAVKSYGVHIGQSDLPIDEVKKITQNKMVIGVTANNYEDAIMAEKCGADYIGSGAVFNTSTKLDVDLISQNELIKIIKSVNIPVCAIGGINSDNIYELENCRNEGLKGIAVSSGIMGASDISDAVNIFLNFWDIK